MAALKGSNTMPGMALRVTSRGNNLYDLTITGRRLVKKEICHIYCIHSISNSSSNFFDMIIYRVK